MAMPVKNWWTSLTDSVANAANSAVSGAKSLANKVVPGSVNASAPLTTTEGVNKVTTAFGGTREKKGYTCTGTRIRKCVKNTRRSRKKGTRRH